MKRRLQTLLAGSTLLALLASGCAGGGGETKTVKIGMIAPFTGGLAAFGAGMRKSAALAIERARSSKLLGDWKIEYDPQDDASDAKQGAAAAQKLAAEPEVAGVIGSLNSSVALAVAPVLKAQGIPMISPANTDMSLTQGVKWRTAPKRQFDNYFRVVTNDKAQGSAAARYAYQEINRRTAVIMHDKKTYGQGLATIFGQEFEKLGGKVATTIAVNPGEGDYKSAVTKAKGFSPDLIFYGGEYPEAGVIVKNMSELGLRAPNVVLLGGDGIVDKTFVKLAGSDAAQGQYGTSVGASADLLPSSKAFTDLYRARYKKDDWAIYGPSSFDAANILLNALAKVLKDKDRIDDSVRSELVDAIQDTSYDGALGKTTFDSYGDTTNKILSINKIEGDDFKTLKKLTVP